MTQIPDNQFADFKALTEADIPEGVTAIGERAFSRCTGLTELVLPQSLTNIRTRAFFECTGLRTVTVPAGTKVADDAFAGCKDLSIVNR